LARKFKIKFNLTQLEGATSDHPKQSQKKVSFLFITLFPVNFPVKVIYSKPSYGGGRGCSTGGSEVANKENTHHQQIQMVKKPVTVSSGGKRPMSSGANEKTARERAA
jgi:hypothetical protein